MRFSLKANPNMNIYECFIATLQQQQQKNLVS